MVDIQVVISETLAGRRIAITGATGFLGTALVERLLRSVPDCELVLIVRPGRRGAAQRLEREILRNDAFDALRSRLGSEGVVEMTNRRISAIAGDVTSDGLGLDDEGRANVATCDLFIHSAAAVSFDSPLDQAVDVNLLGPTRIAATLNELNVTPHLIAVSTCYVAGSRRGAAPEQPVNDSPFFVDAKWSTEVDAAQRSRQEAEAAIDAGYQLLILSDRSVDHDRVPLSTLLATGAVHHHLVQRVKRTQIGIVLETGEAREVHHHCLLIGYGADGINPYLAFESLWNCRREGLIEPSSTVRAPDDAASVHPAELTREDQDLVAAYRKGVAKGMLKVMAKMGISTMQSSVSYTHLRDHEKEADLV